MSELYSSKHDLLDATLGYVPIDAVEEHGVSSIIPLLKLSQTAISAFHPDIVDEHSTLEQDALTEINSLVKNLEHDENEDTLDAVFEYCYQQVHIPREFIRGIKHASDGLVRVKSMIRPAEDINEPTNQLQANELIATGEVVKEDISELSLILGPKVIQLLAKTSKENKNTSLSYVKKRLKGMSDKPVGVELGRWNSLFDQIINEELIIGSDSRNSENPIVDLIRQEVSNLEDNFKSLMHELVPDAKNIYPENWLRSFNGTLVAPTYSSTWKIPYGRGYNYEIGDLNILKIENGIVKSEDKINSNNRESIQLISKLNDEKRVYVEALIKDVSVKLGRKKGEFIKNIKDARTGIIDDSAMDFIFNVTETGEANLIYSMAQGNEDKFDGKLYKKEYTKISEAPSPLEPGYYMVKAGKNAKTGKYDSTDTPLALIKLEISKESYRKSLKGASIFCGLGYEGNMDASGQPIELPISVYEQESLYIIPEQFVSRLSIEQGDSKVLPNISLPGFLYDAISASGSRKNLEKEFIIDESSATSEYFMFIDKTQTVKLKRNIAGANFVLIQD